MARPWQPGALTTRSGCGTRRPASRRGSRSTTVARSSSLAWSARRPDDHHGQRQRVRPSSGTPRPDSGKGRRCPSRSHGPLRGRQPRRPADRDRQRRPDRLPVGCRFPRPLGNRLPHQGAVSGVTFGPDGTILATASDEGLVRIWELARGPIKLPHDELGLRGRHQPRRPHGPDRLRETGRRGCGTSRTGQALGPPREHGDIVHAAAFLPDGSGFFTGTLGGRICRLGCRSGGGPGPGSTPSSTE